MPPKKAGRPIHKDGRAITRSTSVPQSLSDAVDAARGGKGWSAVVVDALRAWLRKSSRQH